MNPSNWITRWSHLLQPDATVLDVGCGAGRHLAWFAAKGHAVTGLDRDITLARQSVPSAQLVCADLEAGPWPLQTNGELQTFGAVVVTNYLWRPLFGTIAGSVAPGGVLLYETFAAGNQALGRPSRDAFLLQPGELLRSFAAMDVIAYEQGYLTNPPRFVQRICALQPPETGTSPLEAKRLAL